MAKFCTNCGATLTDTAKFCNGCGTKQDDMPPAKQQQPTQQPQQQPAQQPQQQPAPPEQQARQPEQKFQQPQQQYQQPPVQQQQQQPVQQQQQPMQQIQQAKPKKKRRIPLPVKIIGIIVLVIAALITTVILVLNGAGNADYFKLGKDQIPSVKFVLGEDRKLTGTRSSAALGGGTLKVFEYQVPGSEQSTDMSIYLTYLREKEGFLLLTDVDFNGPEGLCVVGRNSVDSGYEIQLQIEYDKEGYTISLLKQIGAITPNTPNSGNNQTPDPNGNGESSMSDKNQTSNPNNDRPTGTDNTQTPDQNNGRPSGTDNNQTSNPNNGGTSGTDNNQPPDPNNGGTSGTDNTQTSDSNNGETSGTGSLTKDIFDIMYGGTYHMIMRFSSDGDESTVEMFVKNKTTALLVAAEGNNLRWVYKDGKSYMIMDDSKMIMVQDDTDDETDYSLVPENITYIGEGSGEFLGKTYKYDEYISDDDIRFFYYVDGGALKGIRTIIDGETINIEILALDRKVTDSVFDIPSDYDVL